MRISLLINTNHPDQSNSKHYAQRRWFFSKTSWKTPISLPKCLVWPWSGWPVLTCGKRPKFGSSHEKFGEQGWRSGKSTRLPPMWPGFESRRRCHMWVEFDVVFLLCSERFFSGYSGFPLSSKTNTSKFQLDLERTDTFKRVHMNS